MRCAVQDKRGHGGAFDVPAGTTATPWTLPHRFTYHIQSRQAGKTSNKTRNHCYRTKEEEEAKTYKPGFDRFQSAKSSPHFFSLASFAIPNTDKFMNDRHHTRGIGSYIILLRLHLRGPHCQLGPGRVCRTLCPLYETREYQNTLCHSNTTVKSTNINNTP